MEIYSQAVPGILVIYKGVGDTDEELVKPEEEGRMEVEAELKKETDQLKKPKKAAAGMAIFLSVLILIYFGMTMYFINHLYFGSKINTIDVSGKTVSTGISTLTSQLQKYTLTLKERDGKSERIKASEVDLGFNPEAETEIRNLKASQNPFAWLAGIFNPEKSQKTILLTYNENFLKDRIDKLTCLEPSQVVEPQNPSFQYSDKGYLIKNEVLGNKVNKDVLFSQISNALHKGLLEIDLEASGTYIKPKYTVQSEKVTQNKDLLNKYTSAKITYLFGESKRSLDGSLINQWLTLNENFDVELKENKVQEYINELAKAYSTVGKTRKFRTSTRTTVTVEGGDYGWSIDTGKETADLTAAIIGGQRISKEPVYRQKALAHSYENNDIGNTYVEIDFAKQHIWFYKKSNLIVEGNIVSGNVSAGHVTPKGIYRLKYKQKNVILKGADYAVPVSFWMPFNGGIGLHDANWRSVFGGSIYMTNGSHGCINLPYNVAREIFNSIDLNTPVVCY